MTSTRAALAVVVVALWIGGLAMMFRRNANVSEAQQLAPVAFMLGGPHTIGRKQKLSVFDPTTRLVIRPALEIRAESLFTVVDSATMDAAGDWSPAHRDTVRAWRIEGAPQGLAAWVDAEGRIVAAQVSDLSAIRTAFEIAFKNAKAKTK